MAKEPGAYLGGGWGEKAGVNSKERLTGLTKQKGDVRGNGELHWQSGEGRPIQNKTQMCE